MAGRASSDGFIARNGLWSDAQAEAASEVLRRVEADGLRLIRLAWIDSHGAVRAKAVTPPALRQALLDGYNINVATSTLDASGGRVFASFTPGGGMGIDEMTGSPNLVLVPDPLTYRTLPWAPGTGWMLGDQYFRNGRPFPFSTRRVLDAQRARLAGRGWRMLVGIEIEWYLRRIDDDRLGEAQVAHQGRRGRPLATSAVEPGFSYHSETNLDILQPVFDALADAFDGLGLKLRSLENEFGPGQVECTFEADDAGRAADDAALFRSATRQVCRRLGYAASFICRPAFRGHFASGWHLHQSFADAATGENLFVPAEGDHALSPLGLSALAGLVEHAGAASAFVTPTINGYRRFRPNSLAPDRAGWGVDQRGAMIRVIGGADDPATRLENRAGEPAANPLSLYRIADRRRARRHRPQPRRAGRGSRPLRGRARDAARRPRCRARGARRIRPVPPRLRRSVRRLFHRPQAGRARPVPAIRNRPGRPPRDQWRDRMGTERVF